MLHTHLWATTRDTRSRHYVLFGEISFVSGNTWKLPFVHICAQLFSTAKLETVLNFWSTDKREFCVQRFETHEFVWDSQLASQIVFFCFKGVKHYLARELEQLLQGHIRNNKTRNGAQIRALNTVTQIHHLADRAPNKDGGPLCCTYTAKGSQEKRASQLAEAGKQRHRGKATWGFA